MGSKVRYTLSIEGDKNLTVDINPEKEVGEDLSGRYLISWDAERVVVLPA